jgi:transcription antitermination factor NusG
MQIQKAYKNEPFHLTGLSLASTAPNWYALHTRSNFEARIAAELSDKGINTYLPAFDEVHHWKDRQKVVSVPVFPGYLFAYFADVPAVTLEVLKTRGLVRILGFGSGIEAVPEGEILYLHRMLDSKLQCFSHPFVREGDRVRVKRGALRGLEGILLRVKNQARLVISVSLLSQSVATEVNASDVEPAFGRCAA